MNSAQWPIISDQIKRPALDVVLHELDCILKADVSGDVVELGCYIGTTSLFIRRLLDEHASAKSFHVYDSFAGLPDKTSQDNSPVGLDFKAGELTVSKKQLLDQFKRARLQPPVVHKAWFDQLMPADLPNEISFGFLDGDFYGSILTSLELTWPLLNPAGSLAIDDYQREALPGVVKAVEHYLKDKPHRLHYAHNIAIITKA